MVWFGENLNPNNIAKIDKALNACDFFVIVGTSGVVYPAAGYGQIVSARSVPIAEFNIEAEPTCSKTRYNLFFLTI